MEGGRCRYGQTLVRIRSARKHRARRVFLRYCDLKARRQVAVAEQTAWESAAVDAPCAQCAEKSSDTDLTVRRSMLDVLQEVSWSVSGKHETNLAG